MARRKTWARIGISKQAEPHSPWNACKSFADTPVIDSYRTVLFCVFLTSQAQ